eukprot:11008382-Prorocentrum_lima.AAC.1
MWGCLVWELRGERGGGQTYFNLVPCSANHRPCVQLPILEPDVWKVYDSKVLAPSAASGGQSNDVPAGI